MLSWSLREIFLVIVIIALALGWWLDHNRLSAASSELQEEMYVLSHVAPKLKEELTMLGYEISWNTNGDIVISPPLREEGAR